MATVCRRLDRWRRPAALDAVRVVSGEVLGGVLHYLAALVDHVGARVPLGFARVVDLEDEPEGLSLFLEVLALLVAAPVYGRHEVHPSCWARAGVPRLIGNSPDTPHTRRREITHSLNRARATSLRVESSCDTRLSPLALTGGAMLHLTVSYFLRAARVVSHRHGWRDGAWGLARLLARPRG